MQKNYHLDAYAVDAVDQRSRPVRFEITDGVEHQIKCTKEIKLNAKRNNVKFHSIQII